MTRLKIVVAVAIALAATAMVPAQALCDLYDTWNDAEYLVIAHDSLAVAAEALAAHRAGDGLSTKVVLVSDIYDDFGSGVDDSTAVRDFLAYAYANWRSMPVFVVLMGDADTDDPGYDLVPTNRVHHPPVSYISFDGWYAQMDDDPISDIALSRVPARTNEEASNFVDKVVFYDSDTTYAAWKDNAVLGVGDCDNGILDPESVRMWSRVVNDRMTSAGLDTTVIRVSVSCDCIPGDCGDCQDDMVAAIDDGCLLLSHVGASGANHWTSLLYQNAAGTCSEYDLSNLEAYPFVLNLNCETGRFDFFWTVSDSLLCAESEGAIGVIAPSGSRSMIDEVGAFSTMFLDELFSRRGQRVGNLLLATRANFLGQYAYAHWQEKEMNLLGDPALKLWFDETDRPDSLALDFDLAGLLPLQNRVVSSYQADSLRARVSPSAHGVSPVRGNHMFSVQGLTGSGGGAGPRATWKILDLEEPGGLPIGGGGRRDILSFWMNVDCFPGTMGFSVGGLLRSGDTLWDEELGLVDQYGTPLAPFDRDDDTGSWRHYYVDLSPASGDTLDYLYVGGAQSASAGVDTFRVFFDDIVITDYWCGYPDYDSTNLVANGSFEINRDGDNHPDCWGGADLQPDSAAIYITDFGAYHGSRAGVLYDSPYATGDSVATHVLLLEPEEWYRTEMWVRALEPAIIETEIPEAGGSLIAAFSDSVGTDWSLIAHTFKASATESLHTLKLAPGSSDTPILVDRLTVSSSCEDYPTVTYLTARARPYGVMVEWHTSGCPDGDGWVDLYRTPYLETQGEYIGQRWCADAGDTVHFILDKPVLPGRLYSYSLYNCGGFERSAYGASDGADPDSSSVVIADSDSLVFCPYGDSDSTYVTVTVRDDEGQPIAGVPAGEVVVGVVDSVSITFSCATGGVLVSTCATDSSGQVVIPVHAVSGYDPLALLYTAVGDVDLSDTLSVAAKSPDYDRDGDVDPLDFGTFGKDYEDGVGWRSDFNHDGVVDPLDFRVFGAHYTHDCTSKVTREISRGLLAELGMASRETLGSQVPPVYFLEQNRPNPFNPVTLVGYAVPAPGGPVHVEVYDVVGRRVVTLVDEVHDPGWYVAAWDG
ncbi:hypothetical protein H8D73_01105, partial [bacterium]|nr:hypothetical protein [bacterium]